MVERTYLSLGEASERLRTMGLTGQTKHRLLQAVYTGLLVALKDGATWRTTLVEIEAYRLRLERLSAVKGRRERAELKQWLINRDLIYESLPRDEKQRRAKAYARGERLTWK